MMIIKDVLLKTNFIRQGVAKQRRYDTWRYSW